jgi:two-component system, OmpR family, response regulator
MRILVIEDQPDLSEAIASFLTGHGHSVDTAKSLKEARLCSIAAEYSAVLLDLMLSDGNGLDFLTELRNKGRRELVIIMTAKDQISDRIKGLDAGADDYLVKPFDLHEMLARLHAGFRRYSGAELQAWQFGDLRLDIAKRRSWLQNREINLTAKEWAVLERLLQTPSAIVTKSQILDALYAFESEVGSNTVEVYISQIRRKLRPDVIDTIRGIGYRLGKSKTP